MTPKFRTSELKTEDIRPEQTKKWAIPCACSVLFLLTACAFKEKEIDYGQEGKLLTEEELSAIPYIDRTAFNYQEGDQIKLYYVKDGEIYYEVERMLTDQEMLDMLSRYESIAGIFGRVYDVGVGQRFVEGQEEIQGVSHFDFEEGNPTEVDYLKTSVIKREKIKIESNEESSEELSTQEQSSNPIEQGLMQLLQEQGILPKEGVSNEQEVTVATPTEQELQAIEVEFGFTVQEGNGLFDLNHYPSVLNLLNAIREVNLTEEEVNTINQKIQAVLMNDLLMSQIPVEARGSVMIELEDSVVIDRDIFIEKFQVSKDNNKQIIFTMTVNDLLSIKESIKTEK